MKKVVLLITVLLISVISTACINNLAVQELNNKAKEYMANGETEKAICRLRSSIDLDDSIFETHYNLGVALLTDEEYKDAQTSLENAIKLKPDFADSYYSLALAFENQAGEIINGESDKDKAKDEDSEKKDNEKPKKLTDSEKHQIVELYNSAIDNYNEYLSKNSKAQDKEKITSQIDYLNTQISKYNSASNSSMDDLTNISPSTAGEE